MAARGEAYAVAHAEFSEKISPVSELAPVDERAYGAVARDQALAVRVLEIVGVGFEGIDIVDAKQA